MSAFALAGAAQFAPLGRVPSELNCSSQSQLAKAFSMCALEDAQRASQELQEQLSTQLPQGPPRVIPKRPALELSTQLSQEFLCTPDFTSSTPVEQQFHTAFEVLGPMEGLDDETSRSPAPSPLRIKRPRAVHQYADDSDANSQGSQSRSQGDPSSCSKGALTGAHAGLVGRPPMPRGAKSRCEPPLVRNPFINPGGIDGVQQYSQKHVRMEMPPKMSRLLWDYKVERELGHGNFSTVLRAVHKSTGKAYAIKKSKKPITTAAEKNMWLMEVQALAVVEGHPNIVTLHDCWWEPSEHPVGENVLIKLELCGESLGGLIHHKVQLRESELVNVLCQMASALRHIHALGLAHLDLKPENIYRTGPAMNRGITATGGLPRGSSPSMSGTAAACSSMPSDTEGTFAAEATTLGCVMWDSGASCSAPEAAQPLARAQTNSAASCSGAGNTCMRPLTGARQQRSSGQKGKGSPTMGALTLVPTNQLPSAAATGQHGVEVYKQQQLQGPWVYKLGDFGRATPCDGSGGVLEGDARYMSPELMRGQYTALDKADMFALGATLYELALGAALPAGGERYHAIRSGQLQLIPHVSMKLQQLIKRLMSADPQQRPSADAVLKSNFLTGAQSRSD